MLPSLPFSPHQPPVAGTLSLLTSNSAGEFCLVLNFIQTKSQDLLFTQHQACETRAGHSQLQTAGLRKDCSQVPEALPPQLFLPRHPARGDTHCINQRTHSFFASCSFSSASHTPLSSRACPAGCWGPQMSTSWTLSTSVFSSRARKVNYVAPSVALLSITHVPCSTGRLDPGGKGNSPTLLQRSAVRCFWRGQQMFLEKGNFSLPMPHI